MRWYNAKVPLDQYYFFTDSRNNRAYQLFTFDTMNTLLLSSCILLNTIISNGPRTVFVCNNQHSKTYHYSSTCKGLSKCSFKLLETDEATVKKHGMKLCGWEKGK